MLVDITVTTVGVAPNASIPRKILPRLSSGMRGRPFSVCWKFWEGKRQHTAEECAFTHGRVDGSGSGGGSVDCAHRGGNSGGGGNGYGGVSSAMEAMADVGVANDRSVSLPGVVASPGRGTSVCGSREICRYIWTDWQRTIADLAACVFEKARVPLPRW